MNSDLPGSSFFVIKHSCSLHFNTKKSMGKKIFKWIKIVLVVYCLIGIALYYLQDYILFQPVFLARNKKYSFNSLYREINIPYDNETNLNIIQFATKATVVRG